jgi:hypothetical protein
MEIALPISEGCLRERVSIVPGCSFEDGPRLGRVRIRRMPGASAVSLHPFIREAIAPGSVVYPNGWEGHGGGERYGSTHEGTLWKAGDAGLLPRVHQVVVLRTPWMMGTHQGAGSDEHLDCHPDECTFRVSRRTSRSRGKLFCRLVQPEVAVDPVPSDAGHQKMGFIPVEGRHGGQSGDISPRPRSGRLGSEPSRGEKTHRASEGVTLRNARCAE